MEGSAILQVSRQHYCRVACENFNSECRRHNGGMRNLLVTRSLYGNIGSHANYPHTVYPKKYAHGFCFAVLCCGYTLTDFPISIRLTSLALWQSNDCPSASKATLMNMDKYFMWIHYERLHNHNKAKHNKTVCIFLGIYCRLLVITRTCFCFVNRLNIRITVPISGIKGRDR